MPMWKIDYCPLHASASRTKRERDALLEAGKGLVAPGERRYASWMALDAAIAACEAEEKKRARK